MRLIVETAAQAKDPIAYWADCVSRAYRNGIEQFVVTGHALEHAVADFQTRDEEHWKHAYSELLKRVNMSNQLAGQLRSIARHPVLSDRRNYHALPPNWTTLRELAKLPTAEVKQRIAAGEITPQTKGSEVTGWSKSNPNKCLGSIPDKSTTYQKAAPPVTETKAVAVPDPEQVVPSPASRAPAAPGFPLLPAGGSAADAD